LLNLRCLGQLLSKRIRIGFARPAILQLFNVTGHDFDVTMLDTTQLWKQICTWAQELGFSLVGATGVDLRETEPYLLQWLEAGFHGSMAYMATHGLLRARPSELVPGTVSIISARMDYLPSCTETDWRSTEQKRIDQCQEGVISLYARGRDYHKVVRSRLQALQRSIAQQIGPFGHRVFSDSAPVLEVELAVRAALGWRGKHSLLITRDAGSMFFLGELFVDFALPSAELSQQLRAFEHCGSCRACLDACPTGAIVAPGKVDARRCISYLTIEHKGSIDVQLRPLMGSHIYGCDDCQLICPWNKFAQRSSLPDFSPRQCLAESDLVKLFLWSEEEFLQKTQGTAIRRIGHVQWLRNIAIAMGNACAALERSNPRRAILIAALARRLEHPHPLVGEHVHWAMTR
jgi:epoxyqueuosine reductase